MAVGTPCTHTLHIRHAHDMHSTCMRGFAHSLTENRLGRQAMLLLGCNRATSSSPGLGLVQPWQDCARVGGGSSMMLLVRRCCQWSCSMCMPTSLHQLLCML